MTILDTNALDADGLDETLLWECIEGNDISGIAYAANVYNFDMNSFPDRSGTPICLACKLGFLDVAKELVCWGAKIKIYPDDEPTPLILAAKNGHIEIVKWLVEEGVDVNYCYEIVDIYGDTEWKATALTESLNNNHIYISKFLLNHGASPCVEGFQKETDIQHCFGCYSEIIHPVFFCIQHNLFTLLEQILPLIDNKKIVTLIDGNTYTPLTYSIYMNKYVATQMIINTGADINDEVEDIAVIDIAIATEKIEYIKLLLDNGIDLLKIDCENEFVFEKICSNFPELYNIVIRDIAIQLHNLYDGNKNIENRPG